MMRLPSFLMAAVATVSIALAQTPAERPRIAVLPLKGSMAGLMTDQGDTLYQKVTTQLLRLKRWDVIERAQMGAVMEEGKFQNSGLIDDASAVALGKQLGVQFVFLGSWTGTMTREVSTTRNADGTYNQSISFPGSVSVSLRMVDVQTGRIKATFDAKGAPMAPISVADSLASIHKDLDRKLERAIANEFPLTGTLLKVMGPKEVMMDLGTNDGIKKEDPFVIVERGEDIIHPKTGAVIKGEKRVLAELEVIRVEPDKSFLKINKLIDKTFVPKPGMDLESAPKEAGLGEKFGSWFRRG